MLLTCAETAVIDVMCPLYAGSVGDEVGPVRAVINVMCPLYAGSVGDEVGPVRAG